MDPISSKPPPVQAVKSHAVSYVLLALLVGAGGMWLCQNVILAEQFVPTAVESTSGADVFSTADDSSSKNGTQIFESREYVATGEKNVFGEGYHPLLLGGNGFLRSKDSAILPAGIKSAVAEATFLVPFEMTDISKEFLQSLLNAGNSAYESSKASQGTDSTRGVLSVESVKGWKIYIACDTGYGLDQQEMYKDLLDKEVGVPFCAGVSAVGVKPDGENVVIGSFFPN